jgi:hypothetical protein
MNFQSRTKGRIFKNPILSKFGFFPHCNYEELVAIS